MAMVVTGTLGLVESLLANTLAIIGLQTTGSTVSGVGGSLLDLVLGGLGGVRSELLLGLYRKKWSATMSGQLHSQVKQCHILVVKSLRAASDMMKID